MALIGYPTVFGAYPKKLADVLQGMVARAHLLPSVQPTSNDGKERKTTHVLVLFRSEEELELMMADGSGTYTTHDNHDTTRFPCLSPAQVT